jgi:protein-tyrosine phosphatase
MAAILVVCSGNICRSPMAEGFLRRALERRLDVAAPAVGSAGTIAIDGAPANRFDEDVVDPLGMPLDTYRAIAWELDEWIDRLVIALYGPVPARAEGA